MFNPKWFILVLFLLYYCQKLEIREKGPHLKPTFKLVVIKRQM